MGIPKGGTTVRPEIKALAAGAAAALFAVAAQAQDSNTLAIVVKGLDNPFFEQINLGCKKWMEEHADSQYKCLYTGPASSADEAGEVQIVDDLLSSGVAAIAISPSNAPAMARRIRDIAPDVPVMTIDADFLEQDRDLSATYLGTDNYLMGVEMAEEADEAEARGRHGLPAARQRRGGQHQRPRAGLPRHRRRREGHRPADAARTAGPKSMAARSSPTTRRTSPTSRCRTCSPRTRISTPSS